MLYDSLMGLSLIEKLFSREKPLAEQKFDSVFCALDSEVLRRKKDLKAALELINKAIEMKPEYDLYYLTRCRVKMDSADAAGALDDINKAIELNSNVKLYQELRENLLKEAKDIVGEET